MTYGITQIVVAFNIMTYSDYCVSVVAVVHKYITSFFLGYQSLVPSELNGVMDVKALPTTWVNTDNRKETTIAKESYQAEKYLIDESQSEKKTKYYIKNMTKVAPREPLIEHLASKNCLEMLLTNAYSGIYNATAKSNVIMEEKENEKKIQSDHMEKEDSLTGNKHLSNDTPVCLSFKSVMTSYVIALSLSRLLSSSSIEI